MLLINLFSLHLSPLWARVRVSVPAHVFLFINLLSRKILYAITLCRKLQVKQIVIVQQIVVQC